MLPSPLSPLPSVVFYQDLINPALIDPRPAYTILPSAAADAVGPDLSVGAVQSVSAADASGYRRFGSTMMGTLARPGGVPFGKG